MKYSTLCDDWYVNLNLNTEMDLHQSRETVLHFFEQIQKQYPTMRNFYNRERGEFVLEEDKDRGSYRWASVELRRVSSGSVNPSSVNEALQQHKMILELAVPSAEGAYREMLFRDKNIPGGLRTDDRGRMLFETHDPDGVRILCVEEG